MTLSKFTTPAPLLLCLNAALAPSLAVAQADPAKDYPNKPVRFISPFVPGAGTGSLAVCRQSIEIVHLFCTPGDGLPIAKRVMDQLRGAPCRASRLKQMSCPLSTIPACATARGEPTPVMERRHSLSWSIPRTRRQRKSLALRQAGHPRPIRRTRARRQPRPRPTSTHPTRRWSHRKRAFDRRRPMGPRPTLPMRKASRTRPQPTRLL